MTMARLVPLGAAGLRAGRYGDTEGFGSLRPCPPDHKAMSLRRVSGTANAADFALNVPAPCTNTGVCEPGAGKASSAESAPTEAPRPAVTAPPKGQPPRQSFLPNQRAEAHELPLPGRLSKRRYMPAPRARVGVRT
jgi:hypothetical protein